MFFGLNVLATSGTKDTQTQKYTATLTWVRLPVWGFVLLVFCINHSSKSLKRTVFKLRSSHRQTDGRTDSGAQPRFQSWGVRFLGLSYYTEQNMDDIPSFMHSSVLRNGNHTLHEKSWGGPSKIFFEGGSGPLPTPSGCALRQTDRQQLC